MPNNLFLMRSFPELATGCCDDKLFASVFNQQGQALHNVDGFWSFEDYVAVNANNYAILMAENAERTKSFSALLAEADFNMADTPDGEVYEIEYWRLDIGDGPEFIRQNSTLLAVEPFVWYAGKKVLGVTSLGVAQRTMADQYMVQISVAYNSDSSTIQFLAWLEKNGVRQTESQNCNVLMFDREGTAILNSTQTQPIPGYPGMFQWPIVNIPLLADTSYTIIATIKDVDDALRMGVCAAVTWD